MEGCASKVIPYYAELEERKKEERIITRHRIPMNDDDADAELQYEKGTDQQVGVG